MKLKKLFPYIILILISLYFTHPATLSGNNWGVYDWDLIEHDVEFVKLSIFEYNQFPLYNPYVCGGFDISFALRLSPIIMISSFIFGTIKGLKLSILFYHIIGLFAMYFLCRNLKYSKIGSFTAAILYMTSGLFAMQISEGHSPYFNMAIIPLIFLFYIKGEFRKEFALLAGVCLSYVLVNTAFQISLYIILFLSLHAIISSYKKRKVNFLISLIIIIISMVLLSSFKIIPLVSAFASVDNNAVIENFPGNDALNYDILYNMFLHKGSSLREFPMRHFVTNNWDWHEYASYVGILPIILFLIGFLFTKKYLLSFLSLIFLWISSGDIPYISAWKILGHIPVFSNLTVHTRAMVIFIFLFALICGQSIDFINRKIKNKYFILIILTVFFITIDVTTTNSKIFSNAFPIEPIQIVKTEFAQSIDHLALYKQDTITSKSLLQKFPNLSNYSEKNFNTKKYSDYENWFKTHFNEPNINPYINYDGYFLTYPKLLQNQGVVNCPTTVESKISVDPKESQNYLGEIYLLNNNGIITNTIFTPKKLTINIKMNSSDLLIINQKYATNWKSSVDKIENINGKIGLNVQINNSEVIIEYKQNIYTKIGYLISLISILCIFFIMSKHFKKKNKNSIVWII